MSSNSTDFASTSTEGVGLLGAGIAFSVTIGTLLLLLVVCVLCPRLIQCFTETTVWRMWRQVHEEEVAMIDYHYARGGFMP